MAEKKKITMDSDQYTLADFIEIPSKDIFEKMRLFCEFAQDLSQKRFYTYRRILLTPVQNQVTVLDRFTGEKKKMIMMGANSYLGLTTHPKVVEAGIKAFEKYGASSSGASLLSGTTELHEQLENRLARFKGCDEVILFSSGYAANLGLLSALVRRNDGTFSDRFNHASIIDGLQMANCGVEIFRHNDMEFLEKLLIRAENKYDGKLIVVDSIFSMEGDLPPLPDIVRLAKKYSARIMVDDAHATGVLGKRGAGITEHFALEKEIDVVMFTLSHSLASIGGGVGAKKEIIAYLRHYARSNFFSTSLPPSAVASALAALDIVEKEPERIAQLWKNRNYLLKELKALGFNTLNTKSAIIPIIIGDDFKMRKMSQRIHDSGVYLNAIPYPAVPRGQCRLRITVMATHTQEDLDQTLEVLKRIGKEFGVI